MVEKLTFIQTPSPHFNERPDGMAIDTLVLHYTDTLDLQSAIDIMLEREVSAHYCIAQDGTVHQLVDEEKRAWHAGVSHWRGVDGLNDCSIGIEIVNPGHLNGYVDFPHVQMDAVIALCQGILERHPIPQANIVAHSDIAPERKKDPGERFGWKRLAEHGIGLWPAIGVVDPDRMLKYGDQGDHVKQLQIGLSSVGYKLEHTGHFDDDTVSVVKAFQRRFASNPGSPPDVNGEWDTHLNAKLDWLLSQD